MSEKPIKILAINSLPANGNAGLKMILSVLGTHAIPVPTLLLSGIGNMAGYQRFTLPFADLLHSTLSLARAQEQPIAVYVGYLADAEQASVIAEAIHIFRSLIRFVLIDPVCGDNGRAYVSPAVVESWQTLLPLANLALPNLTEAALLSDQTSPIDLTNPDEVIAAFSRKYPTLPVVITGIVDGETVTNRLILPSSSPTETGPTRLQYDFSHRYFPTYFSGTGDTFASLLVRLHCVEGLALTDAVHQAGTTVERLIEIGNW